MRYTPTSRLDRCIYFLSRTIKQPCPFLSTPCLIWQGTTTNGYPTAGVLGKQVQVRRYVYETFQGQAFGNLKASCTNTRCINPAHLRIA